MNEQFEKGLIQVHKAAKEGLTEEEFLNRANVRLEDLERLLQLFGSQKDKEKIMEGLHKKLAAVERGEEVTGFTKGEPRPVGNWDEEKRRGTACSAGACG